MATGIQVFNAQKTETLSEVAMANVEALAADEPVTECPGGRHLCKYIKDPIGTVTFYDKNGPNTI
mgnify:CR=1 FL=1